VTAQHDKRQKCTSNPAASYSMQHQYKLVSDWDSQWHTLYHHFTTCHQHRYPSSYQAGNVRAQATSHLQPESSDLPKLLTSTRLSLQVPPNQQNRLLPYAIIHSILLIPIDQPLTMNLKTNYAMINLNVWSLHLVISTVAAMITAHHMHTTYQ
jgi:hypothetical protein